MRQLVVKKTTSGTILSKNISGLSLLTKFYNKKGFSIFHVFSIGCKKNDRKISPYVTGVPCLLAYKTEVFPRDFGLKLGAVL